MLIDYNTPIEGLAGLVTGIMVQRGILMRQIGTALSARLNASSDMVKLHVQGLRKGLPLGYYAVYDELLIGRKLSRTAVVLAHLQVPPEHSVITAIRERYTNCANWVYPPTGEVPVAAQPIPDFTRPSDDDLGGLVGKLRQLKPKDLEVVRKAVDKRLLQYGKK
ncbi:hypothetical protein HYU16_01375 [Candidatus Woesearchaeota archaeon]|nr:hypothetical protein [Candidatus Woesearchaeota archaeon]